MTTPLTGGHYEFRLFPNDGYVRAATSSGVTVLAPVPAIASLNPSTAVAGTSSLSLTVFGSNFTPASVVRWNGSPRATTYSMPTQLTATISSADLASAGTPQVTVFTPAPGGGTSNAVTFTVTQAATLTVNTSLVPRGGGHGDVDRRPRRRDRLVGVRPDVGVGQRLCGVDLCGQRRHHADVDDHRADLPGTYEFRLFLNDGFTRAATSPTVTVQ